MSYSCVPGYWRFFSVTCRGFSGTYVKEYIEASNPTFAIGEYWDSLGYEHGNLCYNQGSTLLYTLGLILSSMNDFIVSLCKGPCMQSFISFSTSELQYAYYNQEVVIRSTTTKSSLKCEKMPGWFCSFTSSTCRIVFNYCGLSNYLISLCAKLKVNGALVPMLYKFRKITSE